ncbi:hypothetical protein [Saccharopolyspora sp. NPDC049426]|uniref:hypothetical protein n=1 Tax=Saccharopolyspora sp. NPDC049426 TaxID=3155652 RepID=UPI003435B38B
MSTTTTSGRTQATCRAAFITTLLIFLALATALVAVQLAGLVLVRPAWITWASEALLTPSIAAAVLFGLVAFASGYFMPKATSDD